MHLQNLLERDIFVHHCLIINVYFIFSKSHILQSRSKPFRCLKHKNFMNMSFCFLRVSSIYCHTECVHGVLCLCVYVSMQYQFLLLSLQCYYASSSNTQMCLSVLSSQSSTLLKRVFMTVIKKKTLKNNSFVNFFFFQTVS